MHKIQLEDIKIYAYHGCLPQEKAIGAWYTIRLTVMADLEQAGKTDALQHTINYADLYTIIRKRMEKRSNLLESVCYDILEEIKEYSPKIYSAEIRLSKINPPMEGNVGAATLIFSKEYKKNSRTEHLLIRE